MVFGDMADFAIQAEIEPGLTPPSAAWGRMCVWCRGTALGNIQETCCGLGDAASEFAWAASNLEELWDESLQGLDDQATFAFLDAAYYGDDDRSADQVHADAERYAKFNFLTNWGEQFDGFKAFWIHAPDGSLHIHYRLPDNTLGSSQVTKKAFITAATEFVRWFREQDQRLRA
jgi:hypothetical protein